MTVRAVALALWIFATTASSALCAELRQYAIQGVFRFDYPAADWKLAPGVGDENPWLISPGDTVKDPNDARVAIHTRVSRANLDLPSTVAAVTANLEKSGFAAVLSRQPFRTREGLEGVKVDYRLSDGRFAVQYFFARGQGPKVILDGISPFADRGRYEALYDDIVRSLVIP
jgi:hypothetical protein